MSIVGKHFLSQATRDLNPDAVSAIAKLVSWWEWESGDTGNILDKYGDNDLTATYVGASIEPGAPGTGYCVELGTGDSLERAGVDCTGLDDQSSYEFMSFLYSANTGGALWTPISKTQSDTSMTRGYALHIGRNDTDPNKIKHMKGRSVEDPAKYAFPLLTWTMVSAYRDGTDRGVALNAGADTVTETGTTTTNSTADTFRLGWRTPFDQMATARVGTTARFSEKLTSGERTYLYNGGSGRTFAQFLLDAGV